MKKNISFLIATFFFLLGYVQAQDCPKLSLSSPDLIKEGVPAVFTANISGGKGVSTTYNWSVSAGTITSGQGTSVIYIDTKGLAGQSITATVELGGYSPNCPTTSSSTVSIEVAGPAVELHSKGDYTTVKLFNNEANKFAGDIMSAYYVLQVPHAVIYLYPSKNPTAAAALKQMMQSVRSALTKIGMTAKRYKIVTCGKRAQTSYEMWIVPEGVNDPMAIPAH